MEKTFSGQNLCSCAFGANIRSYTKQRARHGAPFLQPPPPPSAGVHVTPPPPPPPAEQFSGRPTPAVTKRLASVVRECQRMQRANSWVRAVASLRTPFTALTTLQPPHTSSQHPQTCSSIQGKKIKPCVQHLGPLWPCTNCGAFFLWGGGVHPPRRGKACGDGLGGQKGGVRVHK